jgi:hypothetical protein
VLVVPNEIHGLPVTGIAGGAFINDSSLTGVTIPSSVTNIGSGAFSGCTRLTSITVDTNNPAYTSGGGVLFDKCQTTLLQYPCDQIGSYAIPKGVTSIAYAAFQFSKVAAVTIPGSVTNIGDYAFASAYLLSNVTIPDSVTQVGTWGFDNCFLLTNVVIGKGLISISQNLFGNTRLESLTIPNNVTSIEDGAFSGCWLLKSVIIPGSVTNIGTQAFGFCTSLSSVTNPRQRH